LHPAASRAARSASLRRSLAPALAPGRYRLCRAAKAKWSRAGDAPAINLRYLSEESDRRTIIGGFRSARRMSAAPALAPFVRDESLPGAQVQNDDELIDHARRNGRTCYQARCTCVIGTDPTNVVDSELRVHDLDGLRVIDASVMPAATSTNTNAPTIMNAEKGAAALISDAVWQRLAA